MTLIKDQARLDASDVLESTWVAGFPVDPERIAAQIGVVVKRLPLEPGVSGMIQVEPYDDPVVYVNSQDTWQRQQFTIAHELGHFWERTRRGDKDFNYIDYRSAENYDLHEFYADEFAGALLMPTKELRRLQAEGTHVAKMAVHFGVSLPALQKRIERQQL